MFHLRICFYELIYDLTINVKFNFIYINVLSR